MIAPFGIKQIALRFTELHMESCENCDNVDVYQCANMECQAAQRISKLSGELITGSITILITGYALVQFKSDGVVNDKGFTASWSSVPTQPSPLINVCSSQLCILVHSFAVYLSRV